LRLFVVPLLHETEATDEQRMSDFCVSCHRVESRPDEPTCQALHKGLVTRAPPSWASQHFRCAVRLVQRIVKIDDPEIEDADELRAQLLEVVVNGSRPKLATLDQVEWRDWPPASGR
jgi:hypothetical protein